MQGPLAAKAKELKTPEALPTTKGLSIGQLTLKAWAKMATVYIYIWYPPPPQKKTYIFSFCTGIYSVLCIFEDLFFLRHFFADFGGGVYKRL